MKEDPPTRIKIMNLLKKENPLTTKQITKKLNLTIGAVETLLKKMRRDNVEELDYTYKQGKFTYFLKDKR